MTQFHNEEERIVDIYEAANEIDAGAVRAALGGEGIESHLVGDLAGNAFPIPAGFSGPHIWVHESDAPAARAIIERLQDHLGAKSDDDEALSVGEPDEDVPAE